MDIDPEIDAVLDLSSNVPDITAEEGPDAIEIFFENAKFDAAIGKSGAAVALQAQTAQFDKHAAPARSADWNEPLDDTHRLAKRYTAGIYSGKTASSIQKSQNGRWIFEYGADNELIRGHEINP